MKRHERMAAWGRKCIFIIMDLPHVFLSFMDITGTFSFAVAGAIAGMEKRLDPFGVLIISFATAIGGGTIRDLLLGNTPVTWLTDMKTVAAILAGCATAFLFASRLKRWFPVLTLFDALGLAFFTLLGIEKAMSFELQPGICIAIGTITGCFGGVLRDVLLNNVPLVFRKEIYASASIAGGIIFFLLIHVTAYEIAYIAGLAVIICLRLLALKFNWSLPAWYGRDNGK